MSDWIYDSKLIPPYPSLSSIVVPSASLVFLFTTTVLIVVVTTGIEPSALVAGFFDFVKWEFAGLSLIKVSENLGLTHNSKGEKLKEVVHKLYFGEFLENLEVENNKIKLTYKYKISNDAKNINSIALFALINNLEEIEFCHLNTDFATTEYNSTTKETIRNSFKMSESEIVTREQIQEENSLDLENFEAIVSL